MSRNSENIIVVVNALRPDRSLVSFAAETARRFQLPMMIYSVQFMPSPVLTNTGSFVGHGPVFHHLKNDLKSHANHQLLEMQKLARQTWEQSYFKLDTGSIAQSYTDETRRILDLIRDKNPHLLIINKVENHSWWEEIIGNSETKLAQKASCPVLILPDENHFSGIDRILYLTNMTYDRQNHEDDLEWLSGFAKAFEASVAVSSRFEPQNRIYSQEKELFKKEVQLKLAKENVPSDPVLVDKNVEELMELSDLGYADVIAFPYRNESLIKRIFTQDNLVTLILKSPIPVLVF